MIKHNDFVKAASESIPESKSCISLDKLTQKLEKHLAEQVEKCWVDPNKITLDKFLGHGEKHEVACFCKTHTCRICLCFSNPSFMFQETFQWCGLDLWNTNKM